MDGKLLRTAYGNLCALHTDPIEKKPLFHFLPGSKTLSLAIAGCNFNCSWCQNWQISQETNLGSLTLYEPDDMIQKAVLTRCDSIAFTYSEPTIFYEYMIDTARRAKNAGLKTVMVSNGFISPDPLNQLIPWIDAVNIDLKFFSEEKYHRLTSGKLKAVLQTLELLNKSSVWLEITCLLIPGLADSEKDLEDMFHWLLQNGFEETPIHFSGFFPHYKMKNIPPTSPDTIKKTIEKAKTAGLKYPYPGNIHSVQENTCCPSCKETIIERSGYYIKSLWAGNGLCPRCNHCIPGVWN